MSAISRCMDRINKQPSNLWAWYELAKSGVTLEEALMIAEHYGWSSIPVKRGYQEYDL